MKSATSEGTRRYLVALRKRGVRREHFREVEGLWLSSIGVGTYRGPHDEATDAAYRKAVAQAVASGCNVIDTAINYRCQRSERSIRSALEDLAGDGIDRTQIVVATKGGFIPYDGEPPADHDAYVREHYYATGLLDASEVAGNCHAMAPRYLESQLKKSLANLGVETIDIYYLQSPETQRAAVDREEFMKRLRSAFEFLEKAAADERIHYYGAATLKGFRQSPSAKDYLSLEAMVGVAREVAGDEHRFRFIQLPYNLAMTEGLTHQNQSVNGKALSTLMAADALGMHVMSSASIVQGSLTKGLPEWLGKLLKGLDSDVQRAIQFVRSTPGLTTALVGMRSEEHVDENLAVAKVAPTPLEDFLKLFEVDNR